MKIINSTLYNTLKMNIYFHKYIDALNNGINFYMYKRVIFENFL